MSEEELRKKFEEKFADKENLNAYILKNKFDRYVNSATQCHWEHFKKGEKL